MFAQAGVLVGAYFIASLLGAHSQLDPNHDPALGMIRIGLWVAFVSDNADTCPVLLTVMIFVCVIFECVSFIGQAMIFMP